MQIINEGLQLILHILKKWLSIPFCTPRFYFIRDWNESHGGFTK